MSNNSNEISSGSSRSTTSDSSEQTRHTSTWKRQATGNTIVAEPQHTDTHHNHVETHQSRSASSTPHTIDVEIGVKARDGPDRQQLFSPVTPPELVADPVRQHIAAKLLDTHRDWVRRFNRLPLDSRLYRVPGHTTPKVAVEMLRSDSYVKNLVAINMEFASLTTPNATGESLLLKAFAIGRADGLVCIFQADQSGAPDDLVNFLLDPAVVTVVHSLSIEHRIALSTWDSRLLAFKPTKDIKQMLKFGINNHLPPFDQYTIPVDNAIAASKFLFGLDISTLASTPEAHLMSATIFVFDCYARLEQHCDDYIELLESLGCQVRHTINIWSPQSHHNVSLPVATVDVSTQTETNSTQQIRSTTQQAGFGPTLATSFTTQPARRPALLDHPIAVPPPQQAPQHRTNSPPRMLVLPPVMEAAFKDIIRDMKRAYNAKLARRTESYWTADHEAFRDHFRERARQMDPRPTAGFMEIIDERIRQFINVRLGSKAGPV